jgi:hypothetical protein
VEVTACLVTRGDVSMTPVLDSLPTHWAVELYDNSVEASDLQVYGRYEAIRRAKTDVVYVQDDDCVLPPWSFSQLVDAYRPGVLTANMPEIFRTHYSDSCLVGFGAIFDRDLPSLAFARAPEPQRSFDRTCDVYFTALTPRQEWLEAQYENLGWAEDSSRMYRQPGHVDERMAALEHARLLRDDK